MNRKGIPNVLQKVTPHMYFHITVSDDNESNEETQIERLESAHLRDNHCSLCCHLGG